VSYWWEAFIPNKLSLPVQLLSALLLVACSPPPSDARLIGKFQQQRETFEQVRARACAFGHFQTIGTGFVDPALRSVDTAWFRRQMGQIGVDGLHVHGLGPDCWLDLDVWAEGFAGTPARYKSFHYGQLDLNNSTMMTRVVSSLDHPKLGDQNLTLARSIGPNWWLEYTWFP
jgi:hypothetical protein